MELMWMSYCFALRDEMCLMCLTHHGTYIIHPPIHYRAFCNLILMVNVTLRSVRSLHLGPHIRVLHIMITKPCTRKNRMGPESRVSDLKVRVDP